MGVFNAKIGSGNEKCFGKFSQGMRNERGEDLVNFAVSWNLKIYNTLFQTKPSTKWTWRSPNHQIFNEINYIMINKSDIVTNTEVLNCVKCSDHRMVRTTLKLNLQKERKKLFQSKFKFVTIDKENLMEFQDELAAITEKPTSSCDQENNIEQMYNT